MSKRRHIPYSASAPNHSSYRNEQRTALIESLFAACPQISEAERDQLRRISNVTRLEAIDMEFLRSRLAQLRWRALWARHPLPSLEEVTVCGRKIGKKLTCPADPPSDFVLVTDEGGTRPQDKLDREMIQWIARERESAENWIRQIAQATESALQQVNELETDVGLPLLLEKAKWLIARTIESGDLAMAPALSRRIVWFFTSAEDSVIPLRLAAQENLEASHPWIQEAAAYSIAYLIGNSDPSKLLGQLGYLGKTVTRLSELTQKAGAYCEKIEDKKIPRHIQELFKGECRLGLREKKLVQAVKEQLSRARKEYLDQAREEVILLLTSALPDASIKTDGRTSLTIERPVEFKEKIHEVELIFNFAAKTKIDISEAGEKEDLNEYVGLTERLLKESANTVRHKGRQFLTKVRPHFERALQVPGVDPSDFKHLFSDKPWLLGSMAYETVIEAIGDIVRKAQEREAMSRVLTEHNLDRYREFFPVARRLGRRKLIFLAGPTNSGKTYHGLNLLASFDSGVYLAPLRLLALEGQEELFKRGVKASFLTGEERDLLPEARFTASTIEMLNLHQVVEGALIDEIQLLADRDRGWAWTQAFVGVPAKTIILTGSANAIPLVERLAAYTGEEVEIRQFNRLTPLEPLASAQSIDRPEPGTAIIAFSRRDVLELREHLRQNNIAASVIYGNLSPDVRREEARRFRNGETRVLVATDAIGMGLNLPIKKVVFHTLTKFDGRDPRPLTDAEMLQIAGRAGRYQKYDIGFAGALDDDDALRVAAVLRSGFIPTPREKVFVQPTADFMLALREFLPEVSFLDALLLFKSKMKFDDAFIIPVVTDDMFELARIVDTQAAKKRYYKENVEELFQWICAPVDTKTTEIFTAYQDCLHGFLTHEPVHPSELVKVGRNINNNFELLQAEISVKILTLYCWLGYRNARTFPDLEEAEAMRGTANRAIEKALLHKKLGRSCNSCGALLPPLFKFQICDRCFKNRSFRWERREG